MKIVLTRHTSTEWNLAKRIQGQSRTHLSPEGREEAKKVGKLLLEASLGIDLIVSSDLPRAVETAIIISSILKVLYVEDVNLRECSFGQIEGLTKEEVLAKFGSEVERHLADQHDFYDFRPWGGECREDVLERHLDTLVSLYRESRDKIVLIVGHGRGLCTLLGSRGYTPQIKRGEYQVIKYRE